jgi:hypothetical protein
MAAEVLSNQPIADFGNDEAFVPSHDWDIKLPDPDKIAAQLGALAFNFHPDEYGPGMSKRTQNVSVPEYPAEYTQQ